MKRFLALAIMAVFIGCSDDPPDNATDTIPTPDGAEDSTEPPEDTTDADVWDEDTVDATDTVDTTEDVDVEPQEPYENGATAFISTSQDQLISGPIAAGVVGDIVLQNKHVKFVVRNQKRSLYSPYAGALVDADIRRTDGELDNDQFFELFAMIGMGRVFRPTSVSIADDGTYSGTAVVRFEGSDGGMSLIDSILPIEATGLDATLEYILRPDAKHIEIVITATNSREFTKSTVAIGLFLQMGKRLKLFHDGCGDVEGCLSGKSDIQWLGGSGEGISYAVTVPAEEDLSLFIEYDALMLLESGTFDFAPGQTIKSSAFIAVGKDSLEDALTEVRVIRGEDQGTKVPIKVTLSDDHSLLGNVDIKVSRNGAGRKSKWVTKLIPDENGEAVAHLAPGKYDFTVSLPGAPDAVVEGVDVGDSDLTTPVELTANAAGFLRIRSTDASDNPLTTAAVLQSGHDAPWLARTLNFVAVRGGDWTFPFVAGDYTLTVSKGLVWGIDRQNVTITAGDITEVDAKINQDVDTTGYLFLNSHEHSERSIDSIVRADDRIYNAIANGVDIMTPTDHDFFGSFQEDIEELGLEKYVHSFLGCEVSPIWGHTTAAGCRTPPAYPTYFAIDLTHYDDDGRALKAKTASEIYQEAREVFGCEFVGINHPYRGGPTFETYYGSELDFDPDSALPDLDLSLVDGVEVYNKGDSVSVITEQNIIAWFNVLNHGYHIAAIGGSDEHHFAGSYGNPRNLVPSSRTVEEGVDQTEIWDNVKALRSQVVGGPVIRFSVDDKGSGETVVANEGKVTVKVKVEAPKWMGLNFVKVFANGIQANEFVPTENSEVVRLDETFELELETDAHIVVTAGSFDPAHEMVPVARKLPFSNTNPIFVDVDGDGYTPLHKQGLPSDK